MTYPSLMGSTYQEDANDFTHNLDFYTNDLLLCFMILLRTHFLVRAALQMSFYTNPRAQRVCGIYGVEAGNSFAIKCLMQESCWTLTISATMVCLIVFTYCLRIFEKVVNPYFYNITTSAWNIVITMTTVGYGDIYAESHAGRAIAVTSAFSGVLILSIYVLCINNSMQFEQSEAKSFALLQRLQARDQLRKYAVGMLSAAYKLKLERKRKDLNPHLNLKVDIKMAIREFCKWESLFVQQNKSIKNGGDIK